MATPAAASSSRCATPDGRPLVSSQPTENKASMQNSTASATVSQDGQISWCLVARCQRRTGQPSSQRPARRTASGVPATTPTM